MAERNPDATTGSDPRPRRDDAAPAPLLSVRDLTTTFYADQGPVRAVDGVSFDVYPGETVGLVGESGSGKTVTARSIVGLVDAPGEVAPASRVVYDGAPVGPDGDRSFESVRGSDIAMVFQDALSALNPVYTVGNQLKEALRYQRGLRGRAATTEAIDLLEAVGIPDAPRRLREYPHQFSGGMRQRALIAMALACDPDLLICDEPTTALDVTTQAEVLALLTDLQAERDLSLLFITHDMGVIAQMADYVNVMYAGEVVERAPVEPLFADPKHPYTRGLLESVPSARRPKPISSIEGTVPTPTGPATDCRFAPRCPEAFDACHEVTPRLVPPEAPTDSLNSRSVACLLYPAAVAEREAVAVHRQNPDSDAAGDGAAQSDEERGHRSGGDG